MLQLLPKNQKPPFEEFYDSFCDKTLQYIRGKIGNTQDAEDLCSEVFLYCYRHYDDYDPEKSSLTTWLYMVINCRIKNYYRDHKFYVDLEEIAGVIPEDSADMDACIYIGQVHDSLINAITRLPERQQKIVTMRYFEERTNGEIAAALGITPGNVRVLLSRALDTLEKLCCDLLEGE